ncbi:hypothetical protein C7A11_24910 [Pseudomonas simiae]|nr:hypothetical protein C7A11_24910 [Pseudomonas simiae]
MQSNGSSLELPITCKCSTRDERYSDILQYAAETKLKQNQMPIAPIEDMRMGEKGFSALTRSLISQLI